MNRHQFDPIQSLSRIEAAGFIIYPLSRVLQARLDEDYNSRRQRAHLVSISPMLPTQDQVSSGGVAFRRNIDATIDVALIQVGQRARWQLPKGAIESGEAPEAAALREVREETGLSTEIIEPLEVIEYWYVGDHASRRTRFHKKVHFFLMRYISGEVADHDHEVLEARWMPIDEAIEKLAFKNERLVVEKARDRLKNG
jgi:8-oxo-dGTP pyrophosphatase MutT (NUDIX family)